MRVERERGRGGGERRRREGGRGGVGPIYYGESRSRSETS